MSPLLALAAAGLFAVAPGAPATAFTIRAPQITEASGIAASVDTPGVFYVQNDSGDTARFFAIDGRTGRVRTTLHVPGAVNHDWEDLAVGPDSSGQSSVWIADIGDNHAARSEIQLYRVPEQRLSQPVMTTARPAVWRLRYPSGPVNAESLFVDPRGHAYLVTKTTTGHSDVYAVPGRPDRHRVQTLRRIGRIAVRGSRTLLGGATVETTGAAMSADGTTLVIRTYLAAYLWHVRAGHVAAALRARPTVVALPLQRQGEGICLDVNAMYVDSEGRDQPVWRVPLPKTFRERVSQVPPARTVSPPARTVSPPAATKTSGPSASALAIAGCVLVVVVFVALRTFRTRRRG